MQFDIFYVYSLHDLIFLVPPPNIILPFDTRRYDAEQGRIAIYVNNTLINEKYITDVESTTREDRDIKWTGENESTVSKTRIANGFDANDKNFFGCTGGLTVYGGVAEFYSKGVPAISAYPEECVSVSTCTELQTLLDTSGTKEPAKICASETPIDCRPTKQFNSRIVLKGKTARAECVSGDLSLQRCVLDVSPGYSNDGTAYNGQDYAYSSILMRGSSSLVLQGFEFSGIRGKSNSE